MKVLITGITGQDGIYLTKLIHENHKKYQIIGISRKTNTSNYIKMLKINEFNANQNIKILNTDLLNFSEVHNLISNFKPNFVFNFSGPSSVYESIKIPKTEEIIKKIFENLTFSLIEDRNFCNFFQASSSEMFGKNEEKYYFNEEDEFKPNSPYAKGKYCNHKKVIELNLHYDWKIFSGIIFNHESEYRKKEYLFMQLINSALNISRGKQRKFNVGSINYVRDWSYAQEIVKGIYLLTLYGKENSYVLGSGVGTSINNLIDTIFSSFNLEYKNHINIDESLLRKNDPIKIISNPEKINNELGWKTELSVENICEKIINSIY